MLKKETTFLSCIKQTAQEYSKRHTLCHLVLALCGSLPLNSRMVYSIWMRILARQKRLSNEILGLLCAFLPTWPRHAIDNSRPPAFYWTSHGSADDMWVIRNQRWGQHADIVRLRICLQDAIALRTAQHLVSAEVHQIPILRPLK